MTNPIMTPAPILTPAQLQRQTFKLRNQAYWMRLGADALAVYASCATNPDKKRKAYAREARKEYKQAAALYAQAAASCKAWLEADNGKGVRWFYHAFPAILKRASERCAAAVKSVA